MVNKIKAIFSFAAITLVSLFAYIFLHESGHALVAILCGAQISKLSILQAHTWWSGGNFTDVTSSLCHAAGVLLPIGVSLMGILFYRRKFENTIYRLIFPFFIMISTATLIVWVLFPALSLYITLPEQEDVTKFLRSSGLEPMVVSLGSAALILLMIFLVSKKGMFQNLVCTMKLLASPDVDGNGCFSKRAICGLAFAVLTTIFVTVLCELPEMLARPMVDITADGEIAATGLERTFHVRHAGDYRFHVQLEAEGVLTDIRILDSEQNLHYQMLAEKASSNGTIYLDEGLYTLSVIYLTEINAFQQYCSDMNYEFDEAAIKELQSVFEREIKMPRLSISVK